MNKRTLDYWLEHVTVGEVDDYHNEVNGGKLAGVLGWFYVSDENGVSAYFVREEDAFHHRLSLINDRMNLRVSEDVKEALRGARDQEGDFLAVLDGLCADFGIPVKREED